MGRFDDGSDEKIPGSAWAERHREARREDFAETWAWLADHGSGAACGADQFFRSDHHADAYGSPAIAIPEKFAIAFLRQLN